jgi:hypothetical protein
MEVGGRGAWRSVLPSMAVGLVMVFFFVWLFAAALHQPAPHGVRVGFVGPPAAAQRVAAGVENNAPGAFALVNYSSEDGARAAIKECEIAGALVIGAGGAKILVASAGGQSASGAVSGAFTAVAQALGQSAPVEDVTPLPASDSRGLVPFFLVLGVTVSAFIFGQSLPGARGTSLSPPARITVLLAFSAVDGLLGAAAVCVVLGFGNTYWSLAGVCMLVALAVGSATAACCDLFGKAGIGIAGLVLILLGNSSSGSVVGAAFLPQPFRWLSPVLPAGPGLEAVRSALYFGGAGAGWRLASLAIWGVGSLAVLAGLAAWRRRARAPEPGRLPA